jgi:hypothetical protein
MKKTILIIPMLILATVTACSFTGASHEKTTGPSVTEAPLIVVEHPTELPTATAVPQKLISISSYTKSEDHTDQRYDFDVEIPVLDGSDAVVNTFNQVVSQYFDKSISEFQDNAIDADKDWVKGMPDTNSYMSSEVHFISMSERLVSVSVSIHEYMVGAAHPSTFSVSFNYDLSQKKMLTLSDLFQPGSDYLTLLSGTTLTDLKKNPDLAIFEEGAAPKEENFANWNITPDGLKLTFDPYQVAAYAAGTQTVTIPYDVLKEILSPLGSELLFR